MTDTMDSYIARFNQPIQPIVRWLIHSEALGPRSIREIVEDLEPDQINEHVVHIAHDCLPSGARDLAYEIAREPKPNWSLLDPESKAGAKLLSSAYVQSRVENGSIVYFFPDEVARFVTAYSRRIHSPQ